MSTCDTQKCMQRIHTLDTRRRSFDLKRENCVTVSTRNNTHRSVDFIDSTDSGSSQTDITYFIILHASALVTKFLSHS